MVSQFRALWRKWRRKREIRKREIIFRQESHTAKNEDQVPKDCDRLVSYKRNMVSLGVSVQRAHSYNGKSHKICILIFLGRYFTST